ncbi:MAG: DUF1488 family protein [Pseudomonadota bacterium]
MPLFRAAGDLVSDPDGVRFPMKDEAADKTVPCLATSEFLEERSGARFEDAQEMIEEFEIYRAEIEEFASRKYDLGESQPRITKADALPE